MQEIWEILVYKEMGFKLSEIKCITTLSESEKNEYMKRVYKKTERKETDDGGTDRANYIYSEAAYVPQNARGWSKRNLRGISVQITEERKQGGLKIL